MSFGTAWTIFLVASAVSLLALVAFWHAQNKKRLTDVWTYRQYGRGGNWVRYMYIGTIPRNDSLKRRAIRHFDGASEEYLREQHKRHWSYFIAQRSIYCGEGQSLPPFLLEAAEIMLYDKV